MKYTESHEWVRKEGQLAVIGITDHAQKELGEIVYVELPILGKAVERNREAAVLESTKAAADVYAPVSGVIAEVNQEVATTPDLVNRQAERDGWLFKIKMSAPEQLEQLLDHASYQKLVGQAH